MGKEITLGVVTSMLTIGCGGGGGGGGGDNVDVDLCLSVSCINYVSDQAEYLAQDGLNNIDAANANLASATGENIRIAVVDSGIDSSHTEFNQRTILGSDFASSSGGYGTDDHGHGTHVAGIIAAQKNNYGMRGVAYAAQLLSTWAAPYISKNTLPPPQPMLRIAAHGNWIYYRPDEAT